MRVVNSTKLQSVLLLAKLNLKLLASMRVVHSAKLQSVLLLAKLNLKLLALIIGLVRSLNFDQARS
jgi:hypothetical protein